MEEKKFSIAVIGSGVAGLTAAYLLDRKHNVSLFEKNNYLGGHTNTIVIKDGADAGSPVDTGFIVMNHKNYPVLTKLFDHLGVELRNSSMSFGYLCENTGLQYSSRGVNGLFAQRGNVFNSQFRNMIKDIFRFYKISKEGLENGRIGEVTLGEYLYANDFSEMFIKHHIIPMGAAIWSTPDEGMMNFPAESFLRFLNNHGLLTLNGQPQWKTVKGGSHEYVKKMRNSFTGHIYNNSKVTEVTRGENGVTVSVADGTTLTFDYVVIAAHADEAFKMLKDPSVDEKTLLEPWYYQKNRTILHTDGSIMPTIRHARGSWNFIRERPKGDDISLSLTYHMNRLQGLKTAKQYYVTLNTGKDIPSDAIIEEIDYYHPVYTFESMKTQSRLPGLNGVNRTYFCGSYFGYGFHEDAVRSALDVTKIFGIEI